MSVHWKDWCWSWNSNTLATWWKELTHLKIPWCWERLKVGEWDDRGWDGWMASPTRWTWVWVSSGSWWWIGRPGVLQSMGLQTVRLDWATELKFLQSHLTPCYPMDCNLPGSSVHGILQARILEWVAMPSSRGSFGPRDWTLVSNISCTARGFFTTSTTFTQDERNF